MLAVLLSETVIGPSIDRHVFSSLKTLHIVCVEQVILFFSAANDLMLCNLYPTIPAIFPQPCVLHSSVQLHMLYVMSMQSASIGALESLSELWLDMNTINVLPEVRLHSQQSCTMVYSWLKDLAEIAAKYFHIVCMQFTCKTVIPL